MSGRGGIEAEDQAAAAAGPDAEACRRDTGERLALWHANEQRRALIDTCPLAIISMDRSGVVTDWSPAAERIFGWRRDEVVGGRLPFVPEDDDTFPKNLSLAIQGQATGGVEARRRRRDGELIDITFWASPVRDVDGNVQAITTVIADVTDRKRAEAALRRSDERYRAFIAQSSEGIWRFEVHSPISIDDPPEAQVEAIFDRAYLAECNDAMAQMYGFTRASEIIGAGVGDLLDRGDPRNTDYLLAFIKSGYRLTDAESRERDRAGNPKIFLNNLVGVVEGRALACAWGTQRDITERKQLEEQLKRTADELAEANRRKDEFLAMLAHELRNPLAPIMNAAGILRLRAGDDPLVSRQRELVERNARHLARLVDDLLEVSRINEGKIALHREKADLASVVEQAVAASLPAVQGRRHELTATVPPRPVLVDADPTRLVQVLVNVLHNAAKYTEVGGHIALSLEQRPRGEGEGAPALDEAVVSIRDNGRGIEPELLPLIFDLFVQGRQSLARTEGGLGLGLTLARRIMDMHGGAITASSEGAGRGSVFEVRMPIHEDQAAAEARAPEPPRPSPSAEPEARASKRILIIEDNVDAAETLAELLALWGHDSRMAPDGEAGLELARAYGPEIVLLDVGLPGIDGYEVARRLRAAKSKGQRVIALTGYGDEEARERAAQAGFDHHLSKPVDPEALRALLA